MRAGRRPGRTGCRAARAATTASSRRPRRATGSHTLRGRDRRERLGPIARLRRQRQLLVAMPAHRQRRRSGQPPALVAHEDCRLGGGRDLEDQHRFLEPRIEPGEEREVRRVLAVRVDDDKGVDPRRARARAGARSARRTGCRGAAGGTRTGRTTAARRARDGRGVDVMTFPILCSRPTRSRASRGAQPTTRRAPRPRTSPRPSSAMGRLRRRAA